MTTTTALRCHVCRDVIGQPYISLDRKTQRYGASELQGQSLIAISVLECQEMFRYDSHPCRAQHEPHIVAELKLKTCYPDSALLTPCSRCSAPVDRTLPHVSYNYLEGELHGLTITKVLDSTELAVLCRTCEEPDEPVTQATVAVIKHTETSRS